MLLKFREVFGCKLNGGLPNNIQYVYVHEYTEVGIDRIGTCMLQYCVLLRGNCVQVKDLPILYLNLQTACIGTY